MRTSAAAGAARSWITAPTAADIASGSSEPGKITLRPTMAPRTFAPAARPAANSSSVWRGAAEQQDRQVRGARDVLEPREEWHLEPRIAARLAETRADPDPFHQLLDGVVGAVGARTSLHRKRLDEGDQVAACEEGDGVG